MLTVIWKRLQDFKEFRFAVSKLNCKMLMVSETTEPIVVKFCMYCYVPRVLKIDMGKLNNLFLSKSNLHEQLQTIMYKIAPTQLEWIHSLDSTRWLNRLNNLVHEGFYLNPYFPSRCPSRGLSGIPIATSASKFFFSERRLAAFVENPIVTIKISTCLYLLIQ